MWFDCTTVWLNCARRSEEHTSELQSRRDLVCRLLLEKKKIGLLLICLGAGDIKPCVSANVVDQFVESNRHLLSKMFGLFYFSIYAGSFFFFNDTATTEIYTLSLHDALPI